MRVYFHEEIELKFRSSGKDLLNVASISYRGYYIFLTDEKHCTNKHMVKGVDVDKHSLVSFAATICILLIEKATLINILNSK